MLSPSDATTNNQINRSNAKKVPLHPFAKNIPIFRFKHMFRNQLLNVSELEELRANAITNRSSSLFVLVVRSPCEWADAMKRKPWHLCPPPPTTAAIPTTTAATRTTSMTHDEKTTNVFSSCDGHDHTTYISLEASNTTKPMSNYEFFQMPWNDWIEKRSLKNQQQNEQEEIEAVGYHYDNVFALRSFKLQLMQQVLNALSPRNRVMIISLRDFEANPHRVISEMSRRFGLTIASSYYSNDWAILQRGEYSSSAASAATWGSPLHPPSKEQHHALCLTPSESALAHATIDWDLEQQFGFLPSMECQACSSQSSAAASKLSYSSRSESSSRLPSAVAKPIPRKTKRNQREERQQQQRFSSRFKRFRRRYHQIGTTTTLLAKKRQSEFMKTVMK